MVSFALGDEALDVLVYCWQPVWPGPSPLCVRSCCSPALLTIVLTLAALHMCRPAIVLCDRASAKAVEGMLDCSALQHGNVYVEVARLRGGSVTLLRVMIPQACNSSHCCRCQHGGVARSPSRVVVGSDNYVAGDAGASGDLVCTACTCAGTRAGMC